MSELYGRRAKLVIAKPLTDLRATAPNALEIATAGTGLRIQFRIKKTLEREPNTAKITVTNLSAVTRAKMQGAGHRVILEAGYPETLATIFVGDTTRILHRQDGANWLTEIEAQDGHRAFTQPRAAESFASGTHYSTAAKRLVGRMGLSVADSAALDALAGQFVHGFSWVGPAARGLEWVLQAAGVEWSIQNNRLQILHPGAANRDAVVELGPDSGLVGSPEFGSADKKGGSPPVVARALLSGRIVPGGRVKLNATQFKGGFRVLAVDHEGDTSGGAWYTRFEARPL